MPGDTSLINKTTNRNRNTKNNLRAPACPKAGAQGTARPRHEHKVPRYKYSHARRHECQTARKRGGLAVAAKKNDVSQGCGRTATHKHDSS